MLTKSVSGQPVQGFYQNCRGLRSKLVNFRCYATAFDHIFIFLTETWLTNGIFDNELGLCNYNVFRCDRFSLTSICSLGGGVLIGVRKDIPSSLITVFELNVEQIFVRFTMDKVHFLLSCVYIPPQSPLTVYQSHINSVEHVLNHYPKHKYIFCGDYNLPEVLWDNDDSCLTFSYSHCRAPCIPEFFATNCFFQNNNNLIKHGSLLDLVFYNVATLSIIVSLDSFVSPDPYHPPLVINFHNYMQVTCFNSSYTYFNFNKADYPNICTFISNFDWPSTLSALSLDSAFNTLYDAFHQSVLRFIPIHSFKQSIYPVWFTIELKEILFRKKKAHAKFKFTFNTDDYRHFSYLRARYKHESKKLYRVYAVRTELLINTSTTKFWKFIKKQRYNSNIPKTLTFDGALNSNEQNAADMFASYFKSVYSCEVINDDISDLMVPFFDLPNNIYFTVDDVFQGLSTLRGIKTVGPDGLSGTFIYQLRSIIAYPFFFCFSGVLLMKVIFSQF